MKAVRILMTAALALVLGACSGEKHVGERWSEEKANEWYAAREWPVGCDYVPAYAGNQIQMWQTSTWNPAEIDKELGWAEELGFNSVRIFLHDKVWSADRDAFFSHVEQFLEIADSHGISSLVTLFTNGGSRDRYVDEDIAPVPGIHNSIWAQTPGIEAVNDSTQWGWIKDYEQDVLRHFRNDSRIIAWCLYNEPENVPACHTYPLLKKVFEWAREINPIYTRPLSGSGNLTTRFPTVTFLCENCDVLSIHCYQPADEIQKFIDLMKTFNRPIFCTEYLARPFGSTFETVLPVLNKENVAAYSFGLVKGAMQCHYKWNAVGKDGKKIPFTEEPELWFHDILQPDGTPYNASEVEFIKSVTKQ